MTLLRNREVRKELLISLAAVLVFTAGGFLLRPACALLLLASGCLLCAIHLFFLVRRYRALSALADQADRVLHGQETLLIPGSEEGELAVLASEVRKMTGRLREQTAQLRADKLHLSDAIADMFHQLRTPLTSMNLAVSLLAEENLSDVRRSELAHELRKQLERVSWLTETLLKLSRLDAGAVSFRKERFPVRTLLETAARPFLIRMELREQTLRTEAGDAYMAGDPEWTAEALSNLVKNCVEHTPAGGTIRISAAETALYTEISVRDDGPGFPSEDIPRLFERFYKGKNADPESIGIGLALSRSVITAQNGTITARNASGGGAEYIVRFYKSIV